MQEMQETQVQFLGLEDPLQEQMAIHFNILSQKIPGQSTLGGYSPWGRKETWLSD